MLRDETEESLSPSHPGLLDVDVDGVAVSIDGKVLVETTPASHSAVPGSAHQDPEGGLSSIASVSPVPKKHGSEASRARSMGRSNSLRRSGSNIADLRAAFEPKDASEKLVKRFDRSPSRSFTERLESVSLRNREQEVAIARLEKQLAGEIDSRKSSEDRLRMDLERETRNRKTYQDKCEKLEEELKAIQTRQPGSNRGDQSDDAADLQRQLYELKRSISIATRVENQVSDSTFAQEIANLHHELQNFIVNTFRRVKMTKTPKNLCEKLESVVAPKQLKYLEPIFATFDSSMKLAALQATATCYLMEVFNEPLLFGLPNQHEWRVNLRSTISTLPEILSPPTFNKWRYLTLDAVRQSGSIEASVQSAATSISEMICITLSALTDVEDLAARVAPLDSIVMRAVKLSHLFRVQRAQYEFALPLPGDAFNPSLMEDHTVDGEASSERTVACATFPSVIKHGDEDGDNVQLSNIVVKAQVFCTV